MVSGILPGSSSHGLWAATAPAGPETRPLDGERRADVAIVGGGYTGLSAALHLAEAGCDVVLLEAVDFGYGGSGRNVGLVNAGLWLAPDEIERQLGDAGERLNDALGKAPALVFSLVDKHAIACETERAGTLHLAHGVSGLRELETRQRQWERRGAPVTLLGREETARLSGTRRYHGALLDRRAGTIQPLAYARGLAAAALGAGAKLYAQSPALDLRRDGARWRIVTSGGSVEAEQVLLATNAYTNGLWPGLRQTFVPMHYFQFATEPLDDKILSSILLQRHGAWDTCKILSSFRLDRQGRLIVGSIGGFDFGGAAILRRRAAALTRRLFPQLTNPAWSYAWCGRIATTADHLPRFHQPAPGLATVIGYNGRGIGPGTVFGKALAALALGGGAAAVPLPLSDPRAAGWRGAQALGLEAGARLYHLARSVI